VRAVTLQATRRVLRACCEPEEVVESAQYEGAAFELELAGVCHCCTSVWAVGSDGLFKQAVLSSDVLFKLAVLGGDMRALRKL